MRAIQDKDAPVCKKCKKKTFNADFLMMGVKYKCFECDEIVTETVWREKKKNENRTSPRGRKRET